MPLEREWVDGVQLVDGGSPYQLLKQTQAAVEIRAELTSEGAIIERLRKLAPGNLSFRHEHQAAHATARGISRHRCRCVAGGSAGYPAISGLAGEGGSNRHASVLERARGIHSLMFGVKARDADAARRLRQPVKRGGCT